MKKLAELFLTFFKIGLFTFGGGYAMIALIENNCVEKKKWITHDEMMNLTVIAESTPGPIAINCSTYVGYRQGRLPGAIAATLGVVLPSFLIIFLISQFLDRFLEIEIIANAFRGIRVGVGILIIGVAVKMIRKMPKRALPLGIMISSFAAMMAIDVFAWNFSSIFVMLIAAAVSAVVFALQTLAGKSGGDGE